MTNRNIFGIFVKAFTKYTIKLQISVNICCKHTVINEQYYY